MTSTVKKKGKKEKKLQNGYFIKNKWTLGIEVNPNFSRLITAKIHTLFFSKNNAALSL